MIYKIFTALVLAVGLSGNVYAWTNIEIVTDYENEQIAYEMDYDENNIRRDGNEVWVWALMNIFYDGKNKYKGAKSRLNYWQLDCKKRRLNLHKIVNYSKNDLAGEVLSRRDYEGGYKWTYIAPNTTGDKIADIVCR